MAALGSVLGQRFNFGRAFGYRLLRAFVSSQSSEGVEQRTAVADDANAQILQVLRRQVRENLLGDLVLAERRLIPFEAQAPQPIPDIHDGVLVTRRLT